jgi:hypothetical protein
LADSTGLMEADPENSDVHLPLFLIM